MILADAMLPQRAMVERPGAVHDGSGGWGRSFVTIATGLRCRAGAAGTFNAAKVADGGDARSQRPVWLDATADVLEEDRLTVTGADGGEVGIFIVVSVDRQADGGYLKAFCDPYKGA